MSHAECSSCLREKLEPHEEADQPDGDTEKAKEPKRVTTTRKEPNHWRETNQEQACDRHCAALDSQDGREFLIHPTYATEDVEAG